MKKILLCLLIILFLTYIAPALKSAGFKKAKPPLVNVKNVIPGALVDIRYASDNNFMKTKFNGYKKGYCWVRPETAQALKRVHDYLKNKGYGLKFFDCYRPLRARMHMIRWTRKLHPKWLGVYVGSNLNLKKRFGHSCGNAVDVTIVYLKTKKSVNMGTEFDDFRKIAWTKNARGKILGNRMILYRAMLRFGFKNFYSEWWHYTYKYEPGKPLDLVIE